LKRYLVNYWCHNSDTDRDTAAAVHTGLEEGRLGPRVAHHYWPLTWQEMPRPGLRVAQIAGRQVDNQVEDHNNLVGNPLLGAAHCQMGVDPHLLGVAHNPDVGANPVSVVGDKRMGGILRCWGRVQHQAYCGVGVGNPHNLNLEDSHPRLGACLDEKEDVHLLS